MGQFTSISKASSWGWISFSSLCGLGIGLLLHLVTFLCGASNRVPSIFSITFPRHTWYGYNVNWDMCGYRFMQLSVCDSWVEHVALFSSIKEKERKCFWCGRCNKNFILIYFYFLLEINCIFIGQMDFILGLST